MLWARRRKWGTCSWSSNAGAPNASAHFSATKFLYEECSGRNQKALGFSGGVPNIQSFIAARLQDFLVSCDCLGGSKQEIEQQRRRRRRRQKNHNRSNSNSNSNNNNNNNDNDNDNNNNNNNANTRHPLQHPPCCQQQQHQQTGDKHKTKNATKCKI